MTSIVFAKIEKVGGRYQIRLKRDLDRTAFVYGTYPSIGEAKDIVDGHVADDAESWVRVPTWRHARMIMRAGSQ